MKIILIGSSVVQGLLYHCTVLAKELKKNGNEVFVFTNRLQEQIPGLEQELINSGIKVFISDDLLYTGRKALFSRNKNLKKIISEIKPDIIHTFGPISAYQVYKISKDYKIVSMIAATAHSYTSWKKTLGTFMGAQLLNLFSDKVFVLCSQEETRFLNSGLLKRKCNIVYNWVDSDRFTTYLENYDLQIDSLLAKYNLPKNVKLVSCFANFQYRKRQDILIKAINKYKNSNVHIVLAGTGETENELKKLTAKLGLESKVSFLPRIPINEVVQLMHYSDLVVHLSNAETFGYSIIEPIILGKNLITTNVGIGLELGEADLAYVISPDDEEHFYKLFESYINNNLPIKKSHKEMLTFIKTNFEVNNVVSKMIKIYKN